MRIMNVRRAIIILLAIGLMVVVMGCARWPDGPGPGPGEPEYQLKITVEVKEQINTDEGIYYIVLDADGNPVDGPRDDILFWEDSYYYIKLENGFFYFAQVEEGSPELQLTDSLYSGNKLQVIIAVSDLEDPNSVDINVITTDLDNNTYDHLDSYFTISTGFGSSKDISDSEGDSGDGGADLDINNVTAEIITP